MTNNKTPLTAKEIEEMARNYTVSIDAPLHSIVINDLFVSCFKFTPRALATIEQQREQIEQFQKERPMWLNAIKLAKRNLF